MNKIFKTSILGALLAISLVNLGVKEYKPCFAEEIIQKATVSYLALEHETKFGGAYFKINTETFMKAGFALGDSLDIIFSNGKSVTDVPFYNGYYFTASISFKSNSASSSSEASGPKTLS